MKFCYTQYSTISIRAEIVYRGDYYIGKNCHKKKYIYIHYELISKYLATHSKYYEISSKLSKLGKIIRVETLTLNFSIKVGLKIVSKTKMKNCWSMIECISYTVNLESLKTLCKKTICINVYIVYSLLYIISVVNKFCTIFICNFRESLQYCIQTQNESGQPLQALKIIPKK